MKTCNDCEFADWKKRKDGGLHPSREGYCTYKVVMPLLPNSRHWLYGSVPNPCGGHIRRDHVYDDHCKRFVAKKD